MLKWSRYLSNKNFQNCTLFHCHMCVCMLSLQLWHLNRRYFVQLPVYMTQQNNRSHIVSIHCNSWMMVSQYLVPIFPNVCYQTPVLVVINCYRIVCSSFFLVIITMCLDKGHRCSCLFTHLISWCSWSIQLINIPLCHHLKPRSIASLTLHCHTL